MILLHVLTDYYQSKVLHLLCNLMAAFFSYVIQTFWWFNEVCEQRFERPKVRQSRLTDHVIQRQVLGTFRTYRYLDLGNCSLTAECQIPPEVDIRRFLISVPSIPVPLWSMRPDAPDDPSPQIGPAWSGSGPWTPPNDLHSAPECHAPGRSRLGHAVPPGCPPRATGVHSISNIFTISFPQGGKPMSLMELFKNHSEISRRFHQEPHAKSHRR
jgi:hypothetical protein